MKILKFGAINFIGLEFLNFEKVEVKSQMKWEANFGHINWKNTYLNAVNFTTNIKLRYFQYKYLMCILPSIIFFQNVK